MLIVNHRVCTKIAGSGLVLLLVIGIAAQGLLAAQAESYSYVQADCPIIIKQAIDAVSAQCGKTGRGKLCYGNSTITAQFQPGVNNVQFNAPGDTAM